MTTQQPPFERLANPSGRRGSELKSRKSSSDQVVDTRTMAQSLVTFKDELKRQYPDICFNSALMTFNADSEDDTSGPWQSDEKVLFEAMATQAAILVSLEEKIEGLEKDNADKKRKLKKFSEECKKMGEVVLKREVGQFAFQMNRLIVDKVLNELIDSNEYVATISDMEKAIKGKPYYGEVFKTERNRESAERAWMKLKQELRWTGRHFRYLQQLKRYYLPITCVSDIDPEKILQFQRSIAKGNCIVEDEELFLELVEMYKRCK